MVRDLNDKTNFSYKLLVFANGSSANLLIKGVSKIIKNEAKKQRAQFLGMLVGALGASLLGNLLTGKGVIRVGEDTIRAIQDF